MLVPFHRIAVSSPAERSFKVPLSMDLSHEGPSSITLASCDTSDIRAGAQHRLINGPCWVISGAFGSWDQGNLGLFEFLWEGPWRNVEVAPTSNPAWLADRQRQILIWQAD